MKDNISHADKHEIHTPWLSVVIPVYNAEKYLAKCLSSILAQTFKDFEVILVDDGSTDRSPDICKNYSLKDHRIHYLNKENGGPYQARIYGTERSAGTYITFCDADDYYATKKAFSVLYEELSSSNASVIQFGYYKKYHHLKRKQPTVGIAVCLNEEDFFSKAYPSLLCNLWHSTRVSTNVWNKVYHRRLLQNLPHSNMAERIFWGDDQIMNIQLLSTCDSCKIIPDTLYGYRELSGSTNTFSTRTMQDLNIIKKHQLLYLTRYQGESRANIENSLHSETASWFFLYIKDALNYLSESELTDLINQTLQLPSFVSARAYYTSANKENWDAVNLLRKADASAYIAKAKELRANKKNSLKQAVVNLLKKIYASV